MNTEPTHYFGANPENPFHDACHDEEWGDPCHLDEYLRSIKRIRTTVEADSHITDFQRRVYLALLDVPRGTTISYKELGERIGCRSAQAIGQALKRNPFAPYVPCHRVISTNGTIGGFSGKTDGEMIEKKRQLLLSEGVVIR